ncbi:MAG: hypothetical protein WAX38_01740 [Minisyncoccia bacterium]
MHFITTHLRWIIWPLIILAFPLTWYLNFQIQWDANKEYERLDEAAQNEAWAKLQAYGRDYDAREKADTYGGTTPQETWALFVRALEAGDTDLAAKYFVLNKQEEMKDFLRNEKDGDTLKFLLQDFGTIESENFSDNGDSFDFITKKTESGLRFSYTLEKSKLSGVWKIYDL